MFVWQQGKQLPPAPAGKNRLQDLIPSTWTALRFVLDEEPVTNAYPAPKATRGALFGFAF